MDEEWLSILEFPDYMVSNYGRIYSIRRDRVLKSVSSTYHALHNNTPVAGYHVEREVV